MMKRILKIFGILLLFAVSITMISALVCRFCLKITCYDQPLPGIREEHTVVCLSDLHGLEYGRDNARLLDDTAAQDPDAIFVLGDMMNLDAGEDDLQEFLLLMENLRKIAPVCFTYGNHEMDYLLAGGADLDELLKARDITVFRDSFVETKLGSDPVRIGGSLGHYYSYDWTEEEKKNPPDYAMEESIGTSDLPAIVLLHMPETILLDSAVARWTGDLYLSGHTHGGGIRIPGIGGLFAPTQGFFPKYDKGQFCVFDDRFPLIITAGLSGYDGVPRIFNRPEICVIRLIPE